MKARCSAARGRRASSSRRASSGFTLVEVLIAIVVMLAGVMSIIAFERVTTRTNYEARATAIATAHTERWVGALRRAGLRWTESGAATGVEYLESVDGGWFIPAGGTEKYGSDWYGSPTDTAADVRFCTVVNLRWVTTNESMRAEIVTFWPKHGDSSAVSGGADFLTLCDASNGAATATSLGLDTPGSPIADSRFRTVRASVVLRRLQP